MNHVRRKHRTEIEIFRPWQKLAPLTVVIMQGSHSAFVDIRAGHVLTGIQQDLGEGSHTRPADSQQQPSSGHTANIRF
jgi:2-keto-3-deoxy-galactonokinase